MAWCVLDTCCSAYIQLRQIDSVHLLTVQATQINDSNLHMAWWVLDTCWSAYIQLRQIDSVHLLTAHATQNSCLHFHSVPVGLLIVTVCLLCQLSPVPYQIPSTRVNFQCRLSYGVHTAPNKVIQSVCMLKKPKRWQPYHCLETQIQHNLGHPS